jgi:hypothetical protein
MAPNGYAVAAAGILGVCGLAVLAQAGLVTVSSRDRGSLTGARAAAHAELERKESAVPAGRNGDGELVRAHLRLVDAQLDAGRIDGAVLAWRDAYGAALESRRWDTMISAGDAFVKIARAAGTPAGARMNARDAYLTALIRARRDGSVEGALRSAEAFAGIGDRAVVEQSLYVAQQLAGANDAAQERVREARLRWAGSQTVAVF